MPAKIFYAIFDEDKKLFKGRGSHSAVRWTQEPVQTYDTKGRAEGALKTHLNMRSRYHPGPFNITVIPVTVSW